MTVEVAVTPPALAMAAGELRSAAAAMRCPEAPGAGSAESAECSVAAVNAVEVALGGFCAGFADRLTTGLTALQTAATGFAVSEAAGADALAAPIGR